MRVAFRTDASIDIGNGHVMRCLTLADALRGQGADCVFACRPQEGHLILRIRQMGFDVTELPPSAANADDDARATIDAIARRVDWLVVDHYGLGAAWETRVRGICDRLMVIDDLADRAHDCDLLLDQNAGRRSEDYRALVPRGCTVLVGPSQALLRPEFAAARRQSLPRRRQTIERLLVSMGGVDRDNISMQVLRALERCDFANAPQITVVLGPHAPWLEEIRRCAAAMRWPTRVLADVADMAPLMTHSDLSIGAAGVSALERCCVGLPSIVIPIAFNQLAGARALAAAGAVSLLQISALDELPQAIAALAASDTLAAASAAGAAITDGLAVPRIARLMMQQRGRLRRMRNADLDIVLGWRNAPAIRQCMLDARPISPQSHATWFAHTSANPDRKLLIVETAGQAIGFVQFSGLQGRDAPEWGFYVAPGAPKGTGTLLGRLALEHAFHVLKLPHLRGRTLPDNQASINFHRKLGFLRVTGSAGDTPLLAFELHREDWAAREENA